MKQYYIVALIVIATLLLTNCKKAGSGDENPQETFDPTPLELIIPQGFPDMVIPDNNPLTVEGVALGRLLFYDEILSGNDSQSCATCHSQSFAFSDNGKQTSEGIDGIKGDRNAPAVINIGWLPSLFWDGRAKTIEEQALGPVPNPIEMHLEWTDAEIKLNNHANYPDLFFKSFGTHEIDSMLVVKAIAQFERTIISSNSKWDKYLRGEVSLSQTEAKGFEIFFTEKGDCFHCHTTILFTDNLFHNNGLDSIFNDEGLSNITNNPNDQGKFKTPTLRNIEFTAPYMHDGRFTTLEEVIDFYSEGIVWSSTIDPLMKKVSQGGVHLNEEEKNNLIAFVKTLTDTTFVNNSDYSNPFK
ncbi:MAG: cytochrome-c peroxidase [Bacteroidetes bacterium]|nr:cytochrome-c peroxidase [Bacteroidota bacterium]|tara:strand:+ start:1867 stop:2934 length:1068 start_codon:yes stop_codon:yes gene_type:complete